jgi:molecular chaperone DnaK
VVRLLRRVAVSGSDALLGIDLGTTHVAMAVLDPDGRARVVPNAEGHDTTPASIHFFDADGAVVGHEALKVLALEPQHVARDVTMGLGDPAARPVFHGRTWTPQELVGVVLRKLREDAEELRGEAIRDVVLSVPGWFDSAQRVAATEAADLADLNVCSVIQHSTAAVLGFGVHRLGPNANVLVVDAGGIAVEATVLHKEGAKLSALATAADTEIGGNRWEARLAEHLAVQYQDQFGLDPRDEPSTHQDLLLSSAFALQTLAQKPFVTMQLGRGERRMNVRVQREQFTEWSWDLVHQVARTVQTAVDKAGLKPNEITDVLLVGSNCLAPGIRRAMWRLTGQKPRRDEHPHLSIAKGTAIAGVLRHRPDHPGLRPQPAIAATPQERDAPPADPGSAAPRGAVLGLADGGHVTALQIAEVCTQSLGIVVLDRERRELVVQLIPEGSKLPVRFRGRFAYAYDNMTAVRVEVTEGRGKARDEVRVIGVVELTGLPPRPKGTPIEVVYVYGLDQIIEVRVTDVTSGKWKKARIQYRGGLDPSAMLSAKERTRTVHLE